MNSYDYENYPELQEDPKADSPIVVKKSGALGKVVALVLGFVLGVGGTVGGVVAASYYIPAQKVAGLANIDLSDYLSEEYAEKTVLGMVAGVGSAVAKISNGNGTLQDFNEISPKIEPIAQKFVDALSNNYGLKIDKNGLMSTPFSKLMTFMEDSVFDSYLCDVLEKTVKVEMNNTVLSLCYGQEDVDFIKNADGSVTMINGSEPRKFKDLKDIGGDLIYGLYLSDVMDIVYSDKIMMYLAYGKEDIHYSYDATTKTVTMLQQRLAVDDKGTLYNAYGEEISSGSVEGSTYTAENGDVYTLTSTSLPKLTTENGTEATQYYLTNTDGDPVKYLRTTVGDLSKTDSIVAKLTSRLTIVEILGEDAVNEDQFLKYLRDETVDSLPEKLKDLTIQQIMPEDIYQRDANGNYLDKNGNITTDENKYVVTRTWWYLLHSETAHAAPDHDPDCDGNCIAEYKISDMNALISNMTSNMQSATLNQLSKDQMLTLESATLETPVTTTLLGNSIPGTASYAGKTLGELTAKEILDYTALIVTAINKLS